jgi:hypothetical protein
MTASVFLAAFLGCAMALGVAFAVLRHYVMKFGKVFELISPKAATAMQADLERVMSSPSVAPESSWRAERPFEVRCPCGALKVGGHYGEPPKAVADRLAAMGWSYEPNGGDVLAADAEWAWHCPACLAARAVQPPRSGDAPQ